MKIKKLSIRNIASIEKADIDFGNGPLKDAPLFLICGETGSGKTTILDAITLALYGRTPRYAGGNRNNDCQVCGMAFNDLRQLVRRGATDAKAVVELIGNDGKNYEACWSVDAVSRGANKGRLNNPKWTWKDCSKDGVTYGQVTELRELSKAAVGLGFEQFCRTTLLAQGQFTKFLLGDEDAKAQILERLTDTEKFKEIGIAIAKKYADLAGRAETLASEVNRLEGLGQERSNVEKKIKDLELQLADGEKLMAVLEARKKWLLRNEELAQSEQKVRADLSAAFATLKATEAEMETRRSEALEEVGRIEKYLAENEAKAEMLGCAGAILAELGHVRDAHAKKAAGEEQLAQFKARLPELETARGNAVNVLDAAKKAYDLEAAREEYEKQTLEAMQLGQRRKDKDAAVERIGKIEALRVRMEGLGRLRCDMELHKKNLEERKSELESKRQVLPELEKRLKSALEKRDAAQKERDRIESLINNGIEMIVAGLNIGDECPICKSRIEQLNAKSVFSELMAEKNGAYAAADKTFRNAEISFNAAKAAFDGAGRSVAEAEDQIAADRDNYKKASAEIQESAKFFGIAGGIEAADAALKSSREKISALEAEIAKGEKQESAVAEIALSLRRLQKAMVKAADDRSVQEKRCQQCEAAIREAERGIKSEKDRAAMSFDNAAARISDAGWQEAWSANPEGWESRLKEEAAEYVRRRDALPSAKARLDGCAKLARQIAECGRRVLEKVPGLEAPTEEGNADEGAPVLVENLLGQFALVDRQRQAQAESKPRDLSEEDSIETLAARCAELKTVDDSLRNELAAERQKLAADDKCADDRAAKEKELEAVRAMRDEWHPISNLFGDQNGKKIQRAIQSYVLMNVLGKANHYLRQLSDRYELSCEGLLLTVIDANEGCAVRPVNTLSGGEQFLVSLALALGLAGMNDTGLGVDMLLIDEGFGTLSGEHLNSAIEALERLNALTGTRKVGVISHVERLRERIKTHIEVFRNGHEPSTARVLSTSGV